ncbi:unnamed protein product [Rotaria magnacalcarata]|uniref:Cysteine dioxygenase n=1 Tax=Rotaria magnacalcarata TaxID=392030 RepID=A0A819BZZ1_9BILA|nr:unnamed protein product [Rotaria magnacalcarata]CAF2096672.1 unnamed protein product [Rotaria magnacalcarata]CAF3739190.1 unnamed protein product [Rotaria magnacalcarata]CAF3803119.1 unnamed protein product [Rotaria magnacalcarata]
MTEILNNTKATPVVIKKYFDNTSGLSTQPTSLNELIELLYQAFATNEVNIDYISTIMNNYKPTMGEWKPYIKFQSDRYTRNLVDAGNGKFNLIILCWAESQGSSIHNHTDAHCFLKCLQGTLIETKYAWPTIDEEKPMHILQRTEVHEGEVAYINDSIGLHRIENPSHTETAVTLHLYIPPYDHCNIFDERTSRSNEAKVTFYSIGGRLIINE